MSHKSPAKENRIQANAFEQNEEDYEGATLSPPAFQLFADPEAPDGQHKQKNECNDHDSEPSFEDVTETNPKGEFPWDALVIGADAILQKKANANPAEVISTISKGTKLAIRAARGDYFYVYIGTKRGFIKKSSLLKLSFRISKNEQLLNVMRGALALKLGDGGAAVSVVQQIMAEAISIMFDVKNIVTGTIDADTVGLLKEFQKSAGVAETGMIDQATLYKINEYILEKGFSLEGLQLMHNHGSVPQAPEGVEYNAGNTPSELLEGTRNINPEEEAAYKDAISTEAKALGGAIPTFRETVDGKTYGERIEAFLDHKIPEMFARIGDGKQALHDDPSNLHDWGQIELVAQESKKATDAQFGKYRTGPALSSTGINAKIKDAWTKKERELRADPRVANRWVEWRVRKLLHGHSAIKAIDQMHGAIQSRTPEKNIIRPIKLRMMNRYRAELIEIHKGWGGFASGGNVYIQRFKEKDAAGNDDKAKGRDYMWREFQTIIHEYIHTLEHGDHVTYRGTIDSKKGGFTLREGTTDYFTKITYNNTNKEDERLRKAVEGPFNEAGVTHSLPNLGTYGESQNAEAAAGVIGFPNMCAAFFLGRTDLYTHS